MIFNFDKPWKCVDGETTREYSGVAPYEYCDPVIFSLHGVKVVIVKADGEIDAVWVTQGPVGFQNLRQMYAVEHQMGVQMQILDPGTHQLHQAIEALIDMGDPDSLKILGLIDRLLADDWHGCGVYEALDAALKNAEQATSIATEAVEGL